LTNLFEVTGISDQEISNMSDNIVLLRFREGPEMERTLRIIKTRGSAHDNREHLLEITNKGIVIKKAKK
jgi:KaiC/GvpD/RAD55 family RecA-like ATPase